MTNYFLEVNYPMRFLLHATPYLPVYMVTHEPWKECHKLRILLNSESKNVSLNILWLLSRGDRERGQTLILTLSLWMFENAC